jgi:hypothetical protein
VKLGSIRWLGFAALPHWDVRLLCGFGMISLLLIGLVASWSMPARCRTQPITVPLGVSIDALVMVPARHTCTISVEISSAVIRAISVEANPAHGGLLLRGRTEVIYVPHPEFKGKDVFALAFDGVAGPATGTSLVRVTATVK